VGRVPYDDLGGERGEPDAQRPAVRYGVPVAPPRGSRAGGENRELEPGVPIEQGDEPLSHHARRPQHGYSELLRHERSTLLRRARRTRAYAPRSTGVTAHRA